MADLITELPTKPLFTGVDGIRISLAGVQDKAGVVLIAGDQIALPIGQSFTHILKPAIKEFQVSAENEYLTMNLARKVGIDAPEVVLRTVKGIDYIKDAPKITERNAGNKDWARKDLNLHIIANTRS
ncbi:MAG: HipA domain-containing protein [Candidatus Obscuribacterales bacterium]|nr:HipA domain-containing protein [Candidatus Obscuribacterales bacterium]